MQFIFRSNYLHGCMILEIINFIKRTDAQERLITEILDDVGLEKKFKKKILAIVASVSYKGANVETLPSTLEGRSYKMQIAWMQLEQ